MLSITVLQHCPKEVIIQGIIMNSLQIGNVPMDALKCSIWGFGTEPFCLYIFIYMCVCKF